MISGWMGWVTLQPRQRPDLRKNAWLRNIRMRLTSCKPGSMTDLTALWRFNRSKLASSLVQRVLGKSRIALFGPRQTGKTTLLREEVMPLIEERGALAVYLECWADKTDPLGSINYGVQKALDTLKVSPRGLKRTGRTPVRKLGLGGVTLELGDEPARKPPQSKFLLFDSLLTQLLEETRKDLILIFDEFQAVAYGAQADAAAAALRSALAQASRRVGAIFSGSSETMLLEMFSRSKAPLYGFANPEPYPLLGEDFIVHVAKKYRLATGRDLNPLDAFRVLDLLGRQPEPFLNAVGNTMSNPKWQLEDGLKAMLDPGVRNKWTINWFALTDLQRAALRLVFERRLPTSAESLRWLAGELNEKKVQGSSVTRAIEALQMKGLVSRDMAQAGKGFVLSDPVMLAWLTQNKNLPLKQGG